MSFLPNFTSQYSGLCNPWLSWTAWSSSGAPYPLPDQWTGDLLESCFCDHRYSDRNGYTSSLINLYPSHYWLFWSSCGHHLTLVLTSYCSVFLKACPNLDHMTHFVVHGNHFQCFQVVQSSVFYKNLKPETLYTGQSFRCLLWKLKCWNSFLHLS